ncbi:MAG: glycosyl hydrolase family 28-related protein [Limnochordia bacterium]
MVYEEVVLQSIPKSALGLCWLCALTLLAVFATPVAATGWRSELYPADWTPGFADAEGRFLQDFSFAGYHAGTREIPEGAVAPVVDVTQPPYSADFSGQTDATQAVQAAIDTVGGAGGGTVYLPPGTYRLSAPSTQAFALGIPYSNVRLLGAGSEQTYLHLDCQQMRNKDVIRVYGAGAWQHPVGATQAIAEPLTYPTQIIPLKGRPRFEVGDWVVITHDTTEAWIAEHYMDDLWPPSSIPGATFYRQVLAVDDERATITVDAPIRYYLLPRDNARVYKVGPHVEEVGIAHLAIGMTEHPGQGWGSSDYEVAGTAAYDIHHSHAIRFIGAVNSWVNDVRSFKPSGNERVHLLSNGILISHSRFVTIQGVDLREPQYRGGGGEGYHFTLAGNDSLIKNCAAYNGRHNYDFKQGYANGNVITQCYAYSPDSLNSDFHMHLSPANLIDQVVVDQDRFDAGWRGSSGTTPHGLSTTQSVFWNVRGEAYKHRYRAIVYSEQYGWGYVIGTQGAADQVQLGRNPRTLPEDYVEGVGRGENLDPPSLYADQLSRRLARDEIIHCPELDFRPPMPRIAIQYPQANDRVIGDLSLQLTVDPPRQDTSLTKVTLLLDQDVLFTGSALPDEGLTIDTRQLEDGRHTLRVEAVSEAGLAARQNVAFSVSNRWTMVDHLDAPIEMSWFGVLSREMTLEASDGWAYDTSRSQDFGDDESRRVRDVDSEEYLVWKATGLETFAVTLYSQTTSAVDFVRLEVLDESGWQKLDFVTEASESSESPWYQIILTGSVPRATAVERLRLTLLSGAGEGRRIQLGEVRLSGWRTSLDDGL